MVRPPHLPPIGDEEAKRKWKMMNRPSISTLFFPKKRKENLTNNYMPIYNPHTRNKQRTHNKQYTHNNRPTYNNDYQELGSIIKYILLAVIILTLIFLFWWILLPIAIILVIYKFIKKN